MAKTSNLPTANRPDSQGICFIGEVNIEKFLKERISEKPGEVVDVRGNVIGKHKGVPFYTVGQRHGFSISKIKNQSSKLGAGVSRLPREISSPANLESRYKGPLYVLGKDVGRNRLIVGAGEECKREAFTISKFKSSVYAGSGEDRQNSNLNLKSEKLFVRIRHLGEMIPCEIGVMNPRVGLSTAAVSDGKETVGALSLATAADYRGNTSFADSELVVELDYPVFGVAPGQSAVFYVARVAQSSHVGDSGSVTLTQGVPPDHSIGVPPQRSLKHMSSPPFNSTFAFAQPLATGTNVIWEVVGGGVIE